MLFLLPTIFHFIDYFAIFVIAESTAIVKTSSGPIRGEILNTVSNDIPYSSFKGIRYAEPPLGYLRFKPPVPAAAWTDVVDTITDGNGCPRFDLVTGVYVGDEDCLFLNVYSPVTNLSETPKDLKAVMVWIHGGALLTGSSNSSFYGPDFLIENDVIVVTLNYRLGVLGFLALNHPNATGNAGLKDQNLVLQWVQENIEVFGGDPQKVTIFGHSAGGFSVNYHVLSEMSSGLFSGAISMSGVALNPWGFDLNSKTKAAAIGIASQLGAFFLDDDQLLQAFYDASAYDLVNTMSNLGEVDSPMAPVLEDPSVAPNGAVFMSICSLNIYEAGSFSQVPYIMGFTAEESLNYISELSEIKELVAESQASYSTLPEPLPSIVKIAKNYTSSESAYETSLTDGSFESWINDFVVETTDLLYKTGVDQTQKILNIYSSKPVYYYQTSFVSDLSLHQKFFHVDQIGAAHGDDMAYLWWIIDADMPLDPDDPISIIRSRVTRMWTNFAKYRNPTPIGTDDPLLNITWPVSGSSGLHLELNDVLSVGPRPINENIQNIEKLSWPIIKETNGCSQ